MLFWLLLGSGDGAARPEMRSNNSRSGFVISGKYPSCWWPRLGEPLFDARVRKPYQRLPVDGAGPPDPKVCGSLGMGLNHLEAQEVSMARFAEALSRVLGRKVIDRTGKPEKFNVSLQWLPEEEAPLSGDATTLPPDTPAIFTAVQEQLGLRLEPSKALIDLLVIDYAERPSAN